MAVSDRLDLTTGREVVFVSPVAINGFVDLSGLTPPAVKPLEQCDIYNL